MSLDSKQKSRVALMDTTLRDGEQTQGVSFSANEKLSIAQALLQSLKVNRIEIASACVSEGEKAAVRGITATRFDLLVYLYTSSIFSAILKQGSATPGE